jgi:hypothetical protein
MTAIQGHRPREVAFDAGLLVAVPVVLAAIHYWVPLRVKRTLVFDHAAPATHAYLTAAYVHADAAHLHGNLLGYGLVVTYAYLLCLQAGRRRWFHATFAAFLLVLPVFVNLVDAAVFATFYPRVALVSQGFSGVAAGFGGFLVAALVAYVRDAYGRAVAIRVGLGAVLLALLEVDVIYAGRLRPVTGGLVAGAVVLATVSYLRERGRGWTRATLAGDGARRVALDAAEVAVVVAVLGVQIGMLFPADPIVDGAFVGVVAHAAGLTLGLIGARAVAATQAAVAA